MKYTDILTRPLGDLMANCYIVPVGEGGAVVIDPAASGKKIYDEIRDMGLSLKLILLTHGHFDHTGGCEELRNTVKERDDFDVPVIIHENDTELLGDPIKSLSFFCPAKEFVPCTYTRTLKDGEVIKQGGTEFTFLHTPGHTAGSVCYICEDEDGNKVMFSGDTLFKDSIGRSDTYSGDGAVLAGSLDKIAALPDEYIILPGHGGSTTLSAEKKYNPFIAGI